MVARRIPNPKDRVRFLAPMPKRVSYNGIITDFQSEDRSSILLARSI